MSTASETSRTPIDSPVVVPASVDKTSPSEDEVVITPQRLKNWPDIDTPAIPACVARLSIKQYRQMVETGCFAETEQQLELLEGLLIMMSPIGKPHYTAVEELSYWAIDGFDRERFRVRIQGSVEIHPSISVPEPDILVYEKPDKRGDYVNEDHASLVIEVAHSTLAKDMGQKLRIYARGGVPEYWVVDIKHRQVHVHRDPSGDFYREKQTYSGDQDFSPAIAPELKLKPERLFLPIEPAEKRDSEEA